MHKFVKLVMAALTAALVLSIAAGPAAARVRVEARPSGAIRATSARLTFGGSGIDIICNVTLAGSINRLITKTRGSEAGSFTSQTVNSCTSNFGNEARASALVPLRIAYGSIEGTLPTIRAGTLEVTGGFLISVRAFIVGTTACLFSGTITASGANPVTTLRINPNTSTLVTRLAGPCPEEGELAGSFTVSPTQTIALLER